MAGLGPGLPRSEAPARNMSGDAGASPPLGEGGATRANDGGWIPADKHYLLSPAAAATRDQRAISVLMKSAKASGVPCMVSKPCSASGAVTSGARAASLQASARRLMMSGDTPAGASSPYQFDVS